MYRIGPQKRHRLGAGALLALLVLGPGCGLQYSFRRPKKEREEPVNLHGAGLRPDLAGPNAEYVRAYSFWFADHASLVERLNENPKIVQDLYRRVKHHLVLMKGYMFQKESDAFEREVIGAYRTLMEPWPNRASRVLVERRLNTLDGRVRRDFAPGKFPIRKPGEPAVEEED